MNKTISILILAVCLVWPCQTRSVQAGESGDALERLIAHSQENDEDEDDKEQTSDQADKKTTDPKPIIKKAPEVLPQSFYIDSDYNRKVIEKVDTEITKRLYSKKLAESAWKEALKKHYDEILQSKTQRQLGDSMGKVFAALNSSHCNFVTSNDEMYFFLHSLFSDWNKKLSKGKIDYLGFATGGKPFQSEEVRYVLDGSPAAKAGLEIGDKILEFNNLPYVGYANFLGSAGSDSTLKIEREGKIRILHIHPEKRDLYSAYCDAIKKSVRIDEINGKKIGYVHVWAGGRRSFETVDEIMEEKLANTDGLIFDMRDGYGGNSLSDLDRFYRTPHGYPDFVTVDRNGKKRMSRYYYDKPMVAIINGGSRSGKELLSFSLKRTGRAKLVGTRTAGAVLAGSVVPIDEKTSCYIAIFDGTVDGVRLEGVGVAPDIEIDNSTRNRSGYEKQLATARDTLAQMLKN